MIHFIRFLADLIEQIYEIYENVCLYGSNYHVKFQFINIFRDSFVFYFEIEKEDKIGRVDFLYGCNYNSYIERIIFFVIDVTTVVTSY